MQVGTGEKENVITKASRGWGELYIHLQLRRSAGDVDF